MGARSGRGGYCTCLSRGRKRLGGAQVSTAPNLTLSKLSNGLLDDVT